MFWQRKTVLFEHQEQPEQLNATRETTTAIRNFALRIDEHLLTGAIQRRFVKKSAGLTDYEIPPGMLRELYDAGFAWIIGTCFIRKFHYHAAVGYDEQWHDHRVFVRRGRFRDAVVYMGDIPRFALNRVETASTIGINNFTIHSMLPLPTKFLRTDPILVGWPALPSIEIRKYSKGNPEIGFSVENITGVVIAAWDNDKELEF